jgi:hypothetical protein
LQDVKPAVLAAPAYLFEVRPALQFEYRTGRGAGTGKSYLAPNPEYGASIYYHLKEKSPGDVTLTVRGPEGKPLAKLKGAADAGLHRVQWDLKTTPDDPKDAAEVKPGEYTVELRAGGQMQTRKVRVEADE